MFSSNQVGLVNFNKKHVNFRYLVIIEIYFLKAYNYNRTEMQSNKNIYKIFLGEKLSITHLTVVKCELKVNRNQFSFTIGQRIHHTKSTWEIHLS